MSVRPLLMVGVVGLGLVGAGAVGAWASTSSASVGNVPVGVARVVAVTAPQGVKAGQVFNVPLTVTVQVGAAAVPQSPVKAGSPVAVVAVAASGKDTLGVPYELTGDWTGLEVVGWEAYNKNGNAGHTVAVELKVVDAKRSLNVLALKVHYYDAQGAVLQISTREAQSGGSRVAGDLLDTELFTFVQPVEMGRYVVEVRAGWE